MDVHPPKMAAYRCYMSLTHPQCRFINGFGIAQDSPRLFDPSGSINGPAGEFRVVAPLSLCVFFVNVTCLPADVVGFVQLGEKPLVQAGHLLGAEKNLVKPWKWSEENL